MLLILRTCLQLSIRLRHTGFGRRAGQAGPGLSDGNDYLRQVAGQPF
ncbi:hypothetical protein L843_1279 [Mycobacterium intracellulare MIN_061107_1834]|nr:hypothetical protein L843_1279 [Mycobacterium intracellulare MIN_061107_1834]